MSIQAIIDSIRAAAVPQAVDNIELNRRQLDVPSAMDEPPVRLSFLDVQPRRTRQVLVLLHGFAANSAWWRPQLTGLAQKNRAIVIDARGNGHSGHSANGYTIEQQAADVIQVLDALQIKEPVIVAGHSTGGFVATELAIRYPQRVEKLILVATPFTLKGSHTIRLANLIMSLPDFLFRLGQPLYELDPRGQANILGLKRLFKDSLLHWNGPEKYPQVTQPTLVIEGQRDALFAPESYQRVVEALPRSSLVEIGISKHQITLERPKAVLRAIQRFIDPDAPYRPPWRSENDDIESVSLLASRPWIARYEGDMPPELFIPQVAVNNILAYTARHSAHSVAVTQLQADKREIWRMGFGELLAAVDDLCERIHAAKAERGDRILIILENSPRLIIAFFATTRLGCVAVLGNPQHAQELLLHQAGETEASLLITGAERAHLAQVIQDGSQVREVVFINNEEYNSDQRRNLRREKRRKGKGEQTAGQTPPATRDWPQLQGKQAAEPPLPIIASAADLAAVLFTTGKDRRAVRLTHANLVGAALQLGAWLSFLPHSQGSILSTIPFATAYGLVLGTLASVYKAADIVIPYSDEPLALLQQIKAQKPSIVLGTPALYRKLNQVLNMRQYLPDPPPTFVSSGAPLPVEVAEIFQRLSRARLLEIYGLTECGYAACATPFDHVRTGSVGLPLPNTEMRIVDIDSSEPLSFGRVGELEIRGPQVSQDQSAAAWLRSGDLAEMDDDGYFRIFGRREDQWQKDGRQIFARDIEESMLEMPGIDDVAVLLIAGERVAFVSAGKGTFVSAAEVRDFCQSRLPAHHRPDQVRILPTIPRDEHGRLLKSALPAQDRQ